jgi:hypothetical protein
VKLGRLPVKIQLAVQYMPVHPRISGQEWNVQVQITPVIPNLSKAFFSSDGQLALAGMEACQSCRNTHLIS